MSNSPVSEAGEALEVATSIAQEQPSESTEETVSLGRWLRRAWWHCAVRQITLLFQAAIVIAGWIGRRRRPIGEEGCEIMLTGRFDSDNWILAHIGPLSASKKCARLWMVSTDSVPALPKVVAIYSPKWLRKVVGATQARLLTFVWAAVRKRPHVVGGFHLIVNGIAAAIAGRLAGARSVYFCVGGPAEVCDGGIHAENSVYGKMETGDAIVEKRLIRMVSSFDTVVTMGTRAADFFREKGIHADFQVVSGGIDSQRFQPASREKQFDIILAGRLARIKRIDMLLQAVRHVAERLPEVKAVIVGEGELYEELLSLSTSLGVDPNVRFVGRQKDVEGWLRRARIFVLTSDSEGLSLAMMEAMMCGLPAVVSDVGDLGDLVENGVNGYLVPRRSPELFADRLMELLSDERKLEAFSRAAHRAALRYETQAAIQLWDNILDKF